MKKYDTLYSRDSKGKIRIWLMERDGEKYRTVSGLQDGEKVTSGWSIAEPKNVGRANATTAEEQADLEVVSKYTKQLKTGYTEDIDNVDNALTYVEPMLAEKYKKWDKKKQAFKIKDLKLGKKRWGVQCKFNGNRAVATKDGLKTRKGELWVSVPHINASLVKFFEKYPNAVLDGELYNYDLRQKLNELSKIVRKTVNITPEILNRSEEIVKFYVYDGYGFDDMDESVAYIKRKNWIDKNVVGKYNYIESVKTVEISSLDEIETLFVEYLADNQEGAMLRDLDSEYEHKRSNNLLKYKPEDDDEGVILDIQEGNRDWRGAATIVTLKWSGMTFDGTFKGDFETRVEILKNKKDWIGKEVTFLYVGLTGLGTPNYARVDPDNCFKTDK